MSRAASTPTAASRIGTPGAVKGVAASGQLGIFANGYWGHPQMRLSPEVNLLAFAHYLQAPPLDWCHDGAGVLLPLAHLTDVEE